jgi:hypothetical protein
MLTKIYPGMTTYSRHQPKLETWKPRPTPHWCDQSTLRLFGIRTRSNRSTHWNGYNDKPPDLSPVIIPADPGSVTRMLQQLQWDTLEERRARSRSIMLYRILNNLVEVPLHQYIQINTTRTRGSCAHSIRQISTRVEAYKYSFLPRTIVNWNLLPPELRSQPTVESFRHHILTISMSGLISNMWTGPQGLGAFRSYDQFNTMT